MDGQFPMVSATIRNPTATANAVKDFAPAAQRVGVGLSLSGGGCRTALFHLGALRRLNELGILAKLRTISSVSGGSILSAHLASSLNWPLQGPVVDWEERVAEAISRIYIHQYPKCSGT
jgi:NTE family protein